MPPSRAGVMLAGMSKHPGRCVTVWTPDGTEPDVHWDVFDLRQEAGVLWILREVAADVEGLEQVETVRYGPGEWIGFEEHDPPEGPAPV